MPELWTPGKPVEVETPQRVVAPTEGKKDGGSYFDDELQTEEAKAAELGRQTRELLVHLNARPDHNVYVSSAEERTKLREVFNWWKREGALLHNPNIRIEYGVPDGQIRVAE